MPKNASKKTRVSLVAALGVALVLPVLTMAQVPEEEDLQMMPRQGKTSAVDMFTPTTRNRAFPGETFSPTTRDRAFPGEAFTPTTKDRVLPR